MRVCACACVRACVCVCVRVYLRVGHVADVPGIDVDLASHPPAAPARLQHHSHLYTHRHTQINRPCCAHQVAEVSRAANIIHHSHRLASRCSLADQVVVLFPFLHRPLGVAHLPAHNMCNICVSTSTAPAHMQQMCLPSRRTVTSLRIAQRMRSASSSRLNDSSCRHVRR